MMSRHGRPAVSLLLAAKVLYYHLYLPVAMLQGCDLRPYQADNDCDLCYLHYPNLREEVGCDAEVCYSTDDGMKACEGGSGCDDNGCNDGYSGGGSSGSNSTNFRSNMGNPNHNIHSIYKDSSSSMMGSSPNHNTSYSLAKLLLPKCRTSRLHT